MALIKRSLVLCILALFLLGPILSYALPADIIQLKRIAGTTLVKRSTDNAWTMAAEFALKNPVIHPIVRWLEPVLSYSACGVLLRIALEGLSLWGCYQFSEWLDSLNDGYSVNSTGDGVVKSGGTRWTTTFNDGWPGPWMGITFPFTYNPSAYDRYIVEGFQPTASGAISAGYTTGYSISAYMLGYQWQTAWWAFYGYQEGTNPRIHHLVAVPLIGQVMIEEPVNPVAVAMPDLMSLFSNSLQQANEKAGEMLREALRAMTDPLNAWLAGGSAAPMTEGQAAEARDAITNGVAEPDITDMTNDSADPNYNPDTNNIVIEGPLDVNVLNQPTVHVVPDEIKAAMEAWSAAWTAEFEANKGALPNGEELPTEAGGNQFAGQKRSLMPILGSFVNSIRQSRLFTILGTVQLNLSGAESIVCFPTMAGQQVCRDLSVYEGTLVLIGHIMFSVCALRGLMMIFL